MSHGITDSDTMFSVREVPWHTLGTVLDAPPTIAEALTAAGLDWQALLEPTYTAETFDADPVVTALVEAGADEDTITRIVALLPDFTIGEALSTRAVRRSDRLEVIGEVGPGFRPVQNADAFDWFAPLLDDGTVSLETAGSLFGGSRVWVMAKLGGVDPIEVEPGDAVDPFLLLTHGHDGRLALRVGLTPVRVVCNNTLTAALGGGGLITIRHTRNVDGMLGDARAAIVREITGFNAAAEGWRFLASKSCDDDDLESYVRGVFACASVERLLTGEATARDSDGSRVLGKIRELWEDGRGARPGTWWAAYNAVTEYLTHERGQDGERRFAALHFGEARKLNTRALSLALGLADGPTPHLEVTAE